MIRGTIQLNLSPDNLKIEATIPTSENQDTAGYIEEFLYNILHDAFQFKATWQKVEINTGDCVQDKNDSTIE